MRKFLKFINTVKWLGLVGILGDLLNNGFLKKFWLIFLLFFVDPIFNWRFYLQSFKQLFSLPITYINHKLKLPAKDNYTCKGKYILPFEGKWTVVNGGVDKELSHSWFIPSQRYAYDFLIIDDNGRSFSGDPQKVENYYCYGQNIIAPEDGVVVFACDKWEDSKVYGNGKVDNLIKDIGGNSIIIKHNESEYSFIAHLKPNSILVSEGQQVKKGEVIARCGNSGHSTEPHIHFQLMDGKGFYTAAGLPIEFDNIKITENKSYSLYDPRPLPKKKSAKISSKYIQRGQTVENSR